MTTKTFHLFVTFLRIISVLTAYYFIAYFNAKSKNFAAIILVTIRTLRNI